MTVLLQLIEEGRFTLDTTLEDIFEDEDLNQLFPQHTFTASNTESVAVGGMSMNDLKRFVGVSQCNNITLRQLTQHTHGMPDLTFDAPTNGNTLSDLGSVGVPGVPTPSQWTGAGLLEYYMASGLPSQS